jgi:nickel/cobalt transporter (NicO) family protein
MIARAGRAVVLALLVAAAFPLPASAHPLGNFSVNRYSRIELGTARTTLRYVLDLAEIPTLQELQAAGLPDDAPADAVTRTILDPRAERIAAGALLEIGGRRARWEIRASSLSLPDGQAGLRTMRIGLDLVAPLGVRDGDAVDYRDTNEPGRTGWHEIVLRGIDGVTLATSSVPSEDRSDELRRYPADPTIAPPDLDRASARVGAAPLSAGSATTAAPVATTARLGLDVGADVLTALLRGGARADPLTLLAALAVAAALGALHALGPGHGKALVGAYLVGSRGTPLHAVLLGATVTVTHTAGVYALGLLTLVAAKYVLPERIYPLLGAASGLFVVAIGVSLARARIRALRAHAHVDVRDHRHEHGPGEGHGHAHDHGHDHVRPSEAITLRSLIALGVSGGLLPCPTALVVLLAAISFHDVPLGMALVGAFSIGLAAVLTGIGLLMVAGGRALAASGAARRIGSWSVVRLLPAASAVAIACAGLIIALDALRALA